MFSSKLNRQIRKNSKIILIVLIDFIDSKPRFKPVLLKILKFIPGLLVYLIKLKKRVRSINIINTLTTEDGNKLNQPVSKSARHVYFKIKAEIEKNSYNQGLK